MRVTSSSCFATEMARSCLSQLSRRRPMLTGDWMHYDVKTEGLQERLVTLLVNIHGVPNQVEAACRISASRPGYWDSGQCIITLLPDRTETWTFWCVLGEGNKVRSWGTDEWTKWLGLDEDIVADLTAAGIYTLTELEDLTEFQVCQILQPKGPEVLAHPNPTGYIDQVTFDKFERLRAKLDAKRVQLAGRRHELHELQSQL